MLPFTSIRLGEDFHFQAAIQCSAHAIGRRLPDAGLVHHSDRGIQYASKTYRKALAELDIVCSMSSNRDALLGSRGSYVLFPGTDDVESIFIRYPGVEYTPAGTTYSECWCGSSNPVGSSGQARLVEPFLSACLERLVDGLDYKEVNGDSMSRDRLGTARNDGSPENQIQTL